MKYRKKPVIVETMIFTRDNFDEIIEFTNKLAHSLTIEKCPNGRCFCLLSKSDEDFIVSEGDYIIKSVNGEFYPCKPDIFKKTYEPV